MKIAIKLLLTKEDYKKLGKNRVSRYLSCYFILYYSPDKYKSKKIIIKDELY